MINHRASIENKASDTLNRLIVTLHRMSAHVIRFDRLKNEYSACPDFGIIYDKVSNGNYSTPFRPDPIGGSKPVPGCSFNYFYLLFFFKSVTTRVPDLTRMVDPNRNPVYSDRFYLSYQNILFVSFHFRVFNYAEAVS